MLTYVLLASALLIDVVVIASTLRAVRRDWLQRKTGDALMNAAVAMCCSSPTTLHGRLIVLRSATIEHAIASGWHESVRRIGKTEANHAATLRLLSMGRNAVFGVVRCARCDEPIHNDEGVVWLETEGPVHVACKQDEEVGHVG